jgi:hypothetical protein
MTTRKRRRPATTPARTPCLDSKLRDDQIERFDFGYRDVAEVELLAADLVPRTLRADARRMLQFADLLERNALKPVRGR